MQQQVISCGGSRDEKVARVEDGVVIPTGIGTTTVRVTAGDSDISDTCRVTVSALPAELNSGGRQGRLVSTDTWQELRRVRQVRR